MNQILQSRFLISRAALQADLWLLSGLLVFVLCALVIPAPAAGHYNIGLPESDKIVVDFWLPEHNEQTTFRWTNGDSFIKLDRYSAMGLLAVSLRMNGAQASSTTATPLTLAADDHPIAQIGVERGWRVYHVLVEPAGTAWMNPGISLKSRTWRSGVNDQRDLGIVVSDLSVQPYGQKLLIPRMKRAVFVALVLVLTWFGLQLPGRSSYATICTTVAGILLLGAWFIAPGDMDRFVPSFWNLVLLAGIGPALIGSLLGSFKSPNSVQQADQRRYGEIGILLMLALLGMLALLIAALSMRWQMSEDTAIMMYLGYLMDKMQFVPFRDFFEQNMPGAYFFYMFVGKLFGYTEPSIRAFDIIYLFLTLSTAWMWLRALDQKVAWCGIILFCLLYLSLGSYISLQREYAMLLPITISLAIVSGKRIDYSQKYLLAGLLFGLAATIKPHAVIGLPIVLIFLWTETGKDTYEPSSSPTRKILLSISAIIACFLPNLFLLLYMWKNDALASFLDIIQNYWPLYNSLSGTHQTITTGLDRFQYSIKGYFEFGSHMLWIVSALTGVIISIFFSDLTGYQKRQVLLLAGITLVYSIYPVFSGQFWPYHWLPFLYFIVFLSSLCLIDIRVDFKSLQRMAPICVLLSITWFYLRAPLQLSYQLTQHEYQTTKSQRIDDIFIYLQQRIRPEDKVQLLDWTGGSVHALLRLHAITATPFVEDFYFYHHISNPYIQGLRARFLSSFRASKPRYVIQVQSEDKPWVYGADTTRDFPALQHILDTAYAVVHQGEGYLIYESLR